MPAASRRFPRAKKTWDALEPKFTEGRAGVPRDMPATANTTPIETEIPEKATRRHFSNEYKLRVLEEADKCTKPGEVGAPLRREGLYSSHLTTWRALRRDGTLKALGRKRGPKPKRTAEQPEADELRRENERLREKLRKAEKIIEVQKNLRKCWARRSPRTRGEASPGRARRASRRPDCGRGPGRTEVDSLPMAKARYGPRRPRPKLRRALSEAERAKVLEVLHSERFVDKAPATIHSMLLDDKEHLCPRERCTGSWPTRAKSASVATSCATERTRDPSCLRRPPTRCGRGT